MDNFVIMREPAAEDCDVFSSEIWNDLRDFGSIVSSGIVNLVWFGLEIFHINYDQLEMVCIVQNNSFKHTTII